MTFQELEVGDTFTVLVNSYEYSKTEEYESHNCYNWDLHKSFKFEPTTTVQKTGDIRE